MFDVIERIELVGPRHVHGVGEFQVPGSGDRKDECEIVGVRFRRPDLEELGECVV